MEQPLNFRIVKTWDGKIQFINNKITITVAHFVDNNGKHEIILPETANAQLVCGGRRYIVTNVNAISTVEDWYREDLLPKMQMLQLLVSPEEVEKQQPEIFREE